MKLRVEPISRQLADNYIAEFHRHHAPVNQLAYCGSAFVIGAFNGDRMAGVAIAGTPANRAFAAAGDIIEVRRVATDGTRNAPSILLGACAKAARALGYDRIVTYTLTSESGSSLRAVGWQPTELPPDDWQRRRNNNRQQEPLFATPQAHEAVPKVRWERNL